MIALEDSVGDVLADDGSNCCILCAKLASNSTTLFALDNMVRLCVYFVVLIVCLCEHVHACVCVLCCLFVRFILKKVKKRWIVGG
jgi:hypothetical protein